MYMKSLVRNANGNAITSFTKELNPTGVGIYIYIYVGNMQSAFEDNGRGLLVYTTYKVFHINL